MRARVEIEQEKEEQMPGRTSNARHAPAYGRPEARTVDSTPAALQYDSTLSDVVEYGSAA